MIVLADLLPLVASLGFAAMGLVALVRPRIVSAQFGIALRTPHARAEVRAVYGGFGVGLAGVLGAVALLPELRKPEPRPA